MKKINFKSRIIAHRGIHNNLDIPENSIKSFKEAIKQKLPIEFDVQLTKDNKIIIFHDYNLKRMTNLDEEIKNKTYQELNNLYLLNTKEKIPTLKEVLKLVNNQVPLDIEIKGLKKLKLTCELISKELEEYQGEYIVKSFNPKIVNWFKKNKPTITTGLLIHHRCGNKKLDPILQSKTIIKYSKPDFIAISKVLLEKKKFQNLTKKYQTMIWTIKNQEEITKINNNNFYYICNNLPYKKDSL